MTSNQFPVDLWRGLVNAEMALRGYSDEEIAAAERHSCKEFGCEFDWNHSCFVCHDEEGNSAHPVADEYGEVVGVIERALEGALPHLRSLQVETQVHTGRLLGRAEALEDAEAAIKAWRDGDDSTREFRMGLGVAAKIVRDMASEGRKRASEPRTDLPVGPSHPQDSEPARKRCSDCGFWRPSSGLDHHPRCPRSQEPK